MEDHAVHNVLNFFPPPFFFKFSLKLQCHTKPDLVSAAELDS